MSKSLSIASLSPLRPGTLITFKRPIFLYNNPYDYAGRNYEPSDFAIVIAILPLVDRSDVHTTKIALMMKGRLQWLFVYGLDNSDYLIRGKV